MLGSLAIFIYSREFLLFPGIIEFSKTSISEIKNNLDIKNPSISMADKRSVVDFLKFCSDDSIREMVALA